jgi:hypothetical protein
MSVHENRHNGEDMDKTEWTGIESQERNSFVKGKGDLRVVCSEKKKKRRIYCLVFSGFYSREKKNNSILISYTVNHEF